MEPFDLEAAKAGAPVITRDGKRGRFVAHVPECPPMYRVIVKIDGYDAVLSFFENGRYAADREVGYDLFMAPKKRTVWVNFYPHADARWHESEEEANKLATRNRLGNRAYPVEIEE